MFHDPSLTIKGWVFGIRAGDISIVTYEAKFHALFHQASQLLTSKEQRIHLYIKDLNYDIQVLSVFMNSQEKGPMMFFTKWIS